MWSLFCNPRRLLPEEPHRTRNKNRNKNSTRIMLHYVFSVRNARYWTVSDIWLDFLGIFSLQVFSVYIHTFCSPNCREHEVSLMEELKGLWRFCVALFVSSLKPEVNGEFFSNYRSTCTSLRFLAKTKLWTCDSDLVCVLLLWCNLLMILFLFSRLGTRICCYFHITLRSVQI